MAVKNVLVAGGAGYVGGAVTDVLREHGGYHVRVYDNLLYEDTYRKDVEFVFGDVGDVLQLEKQLQWADVVLWLAAIVGDGACTLEPNLTVRVNQDAVQRLRDRFQGRILFTSTCSVYGAQPGILTEDSPVHPLSLYAGTKRKAESFLEGTNALIVRLGTLFGVGDQFSRVRMDLVVNYMTAHACANGEITVFGGEQFRPLLHVRDVAQLLVQEIDTAHTGTFNLVCQNVRMIDLAYQIRTHFPDLAVHTADLPFEDTRNYRVRGERAQTTLGFSPTRTIDDGIEEIRQLMAERKIKHWEDPRYSNHQFLRKLFGDHARVATPTP